jgi:cell wall-associated NlpC family hydrolase
MQKIFLYIFLSMAGITFLSACSPKTNTTAKYSSKEVNSKKSDKKNDKYVIQFIKQKSGLSESVISKNIKLYRFIEDWYGTPYKMGGNSKKGIDCSGFTNLLYKEIYEKNIPRNTAAIYKDLKKKKYKDLKEGDIVFFNFDNKKLSHVGVYLGDGRFVHASTSKGIIINNINDTYYKKYFETGGIIK